MTFFGTVKNIQKTKNKKNTMSQSGIRSRLRVELWRYCSSIDTLLSFDLYRGVTSIELQYLSRRTLLFYSQSPWSLLNGSCWRSKFPRKSKKIRERSGKLGKGWTRARLSSFIILLSFDLWRSYAYRNAVPFKDDSSCLLPKSLESSEW